MPVITARELCFLLYIGVAYLIFNNIYSVQPNSFIDEIFHIPQTLKYCNGTFNEWDPKITTLPGLYIASFLAHSLLNIHCTVYSLRFMNVIFSTMNFCVIYSIISFLYGNGKGCKNETEIAWNAVNISVFPVLYFFTFLYYTDILSTFLVLLMYRLDLGGSFWTASMIGFLGVLVRQTNIVWVGYFLLAHLLDFVKTEFTSYLNKCARILINKDFNKLLDYLKKERKIHLHLIQHCSSLGGYIIVCTVFVIFLFINKGIVVGDRSAHEPVIHLCQLLYFSLFCFILMFSLFITKLKQLIKTLVKNFKSTLVCSLILILIIKYNTMAHLYLISDNRHYTFYIWNRIYERFHLMRYALIPLYIFGMFGINDHLKPYPWAFAYWLCIILSLVPQKLLEFRYFIVPYMMLRLNMKPQWWQLAIESALFLLINTFVIYIFNTKVFFWHDSTEPHRIIW